MFFFAAKIVIYFELNKCFCKKMYICCIFSSEFGFSYDEGIYSKQSEGVDYQRLPHGYELNKKAQLLPHISWLTTSHHQIREACAHMEQSQF